MEKNDPSVFNHSFCRTTDAGINLVIEDKPLYIERNEYEQYKFELDLMYRLRNERGLLPDYSRYSNKTLRNIAIGLEDANRTFIIYDNQLSKLYNEMKEEESKDKENG